METLRQVNQFTICLFRFFVGILLLLILYKTLISLIIQPEWESVSYLLLLALLCAGYGLGFGQKLEQWFSIKEQNLTSQ